MSTRIETGFAFIERCATQPDVEKLIADFLECIRAFGFEGAAGGAWEGNGANRISRFFFIDWPPDVLRAYSERNLESRDPLVFAARRRIAPFTWDEVYSDPHLPDDSREVYQFANDFGWIDGFSIPIHGPGGYQGLVSLLAREKLALTPRDRAVLEAMARTLHERCRNTVGLGSPDTAVPKLTMRETECMRWVAAGKSDWEVGQVLGISSATAHFHVERVKKKLNKATRTEAVATLVLHGLI